MIGDMHCHSTMSDGSTPVDMLVDFAIRAGMDFIAVTDHDTMAGVSRAVSLGKKVGLRVVPGLEISTKDSKTGRNAHLLCYMPLYPAKLEPMISKTIASRNEQAQCVIAQVSKHYPLKKQDVEKAVAGGTAIYRQHIMRALMEQGYSREVFDPVFSEVFHSIPYEIVLPDVREAADLIRKAGGVAVLAHPGWYDSIDLARELAADGRIQGIELMHPRNDDECKKQILKLVDEFSLIPLGGTDYHGYCSPNPHPIGTCTTPGEVLDLLIRVRDRLNKEDRI